MNMKLTKNWNALRQLALLAVFSSMALVASAADLTKPEMARMAREVRSELAGLGNYTVFDNIMYKVDGDRTVTLIGQVRQPALKSAAETSVKNGVDGIEIIDNQIEVLPVSSQDDGIRQAAFQAIYGHPALVRYATFSILPIRIIVKNGDVELIGSVPSEVDKNVAGAQVNSVAGVHSVTNHIEVQKSE